MDYRNFGVNAPGDERQRTVRWWADDLDESEAANAVTDALKLLEGQQTARERQYARDARLYGNSRALAMSGLRGFRAPANDAAFRLDRGITYNVVQSVIDTVVARIGKNRPKPYFLTNGGDYKQQRKAKRLNMFCDGLFYEVQAHRKGVKALLDACVWGDGIIHPYMCDGRVAWERVFPFELFVDEVEALHGEPRQMYRVKDVDRGILCERFPDKREIIEGAPAARYDEATVNRISDMVTVRESWLLPSKPGAKDGKHCISVENGLLTDVEPWEHDFFPFARFGWSPQMAGFWSQGLAAQLQGIQIEINKLLQVIQRTYHLGGTFKILMEHGSKIVKEHLNNEIGAVITYTGTRPDYVTPPLVQPEIYSHLSTLIQRAYEQAGVSMMSATSQKPLGIESGKAMRTLNDIESDRFHTFGRSYENFYLDLAEMSIALVAAQGGSYKVSAPGRGSFRDVDWKDIDLPRDAYVMQCFPVSSLPSDPAGRLQTVQEMMTAGLLSPRRGRKLLDFPDLEAEESLANAAEDYLELVLDQIIEDGVYTAPEPFDDLALAQEMVLEYYAAGRAQGLPEDRLALLRQFAQQVATLLNPPAPPAPPSPALPPGPMEAGAPPMPPGLPGGDMTLPPGMPPGLPAPMPVQ